jgi:hypothetical protein
MTHVVIGIDPDMHRPGIGVLDFDDGSLLAVGCPKIATGLTGQEAIEEWANSGRGLLRGLLQSLKEPCVRAIAVEGQEIVSSAKRGANPGDLLRLATIAGFLVAEAGYECKHETYFPLPQRWKGSVPKDIHQSRILSRLGILSQKRAGYSAPAPSGFANVLGASDLNVSDWKHVVDGIGLAAWAITEHGRRHRAKS